MCEPAHPHPPPDTAILPADRAAGVAGTQGALSGCPEPEANPPVVTQALTEQEDPTPPAVTAGAVACPDCDLLQLVPELPPGAKALCARCGRTLASGSRDPLDRPLALCIAALLALIIANTSPLMSLSVAGRHASTTIIGGAWQMWLQGQGLTALIVVFCAVVAPVGYVLLTLVVLLAVRRPPAPRWIAVLLRSASAMRPWSMNEVMLLGILVALIKIADLARVETGIGIVAVSALVLLFPALIVSLDPDAIWRRVRWADRVPPRAGGFRSGSADQAP